MTLVLAAAGKIRHPALRALAEEYAARTRRYMPLDVREVRAASGERNPAVARRREGKKLLATLPEKGYVVALAPAGRAMGTADFAAFLGRQRDRGVPALAFAVGGEEGLDEGVLARADMRLSLTPMTLPHELARVVLLEQIYRAATLLAGHPYAR